MDNFNPNDVGVANGNYFGLPYSLQESDIVLVSVPWDATVSYCAGTSDGPQAIIDASIQVDLFDEAIENAWETKIATVPVDKNILKLNKKSRKQAQEIIESLEKGKQADESLLEEVNTASNDLNNYVEAVSKKFLDEDKLVAVVGGEHSVPYGLIKALSDKNNNFGILHIDAHADLRQAYEGFEFSHASIMYNVIKNIPQVSAITQVAIRDFCNDEYNLINSNNRLHSFTDRQISEQKFNGQSWKSICEGIIYTLPDKVYISFDIDGLSPDLCPNTGTPVPGGLSFREADYLLEQLVNSGKTIIGFDLCEVAPGSQGEWDANVGSRVLFKLCQWAKMSSKK